jgi:hypothetical protein
MDLFQLSDVIRNEESAIKWCIDRQFILKWISRVTIGHMNQLTIDRDTYNQAILSHLNDHSTYQRIDNYKCHQTENNINTFCRGLCQPRNIRPIVNSSRGPCQHLTWFTLHLIKHLSNYLKFYIDVPL